MDTKPVSSTRRTFLSRTLATTSALGATTAASAAQTVRSAGRVIGANDRIRVGIIGMGGMGTVHLRAFMEQSEVEKDIEVVAVCDVYEKRRERARDIAG